MLPRSVRQTIVDRLEPNFYTVIPWRERRSFSACFFHAARKFFRSRSADLSIYACMIARISSGEYPSVILAFFRFIPPLSRRWSYLSIKSRALGRYAVRLRTSRKSMPRRRGRWRHDWREHWGWRHTWRWWRIVFFAHDLKRVFDSANHVMTKKEMPCENKQ